MLLGLPFGVGWVNEVWNRVNSILRDNGTRPGCCCLSRGPGLRRGRRSLSRLGFWRITASESFSHNESARAALQWGIPVSVRASIGALCTSSDTLMIIFNSVAPPVPASFVCFLLTSPAAANLNFPATAKKDYMKPNGKATMPVYLCRNGGFND